MGYAVYFVDHRWAGYGVPAECDMPDCHTLIDRGLGYKCDEATEWEVDENGEDVELLVEGCGMFFCEEHRYLNCSEKHVSVVPKDELPAWMLFQLTDPSWAKWREEEPGKVAHYEEVLKDPEVRAAAEKSLAELN